MYVPEIGWPQNGQFMSTQKKFIHKKRVFTEGFKRELVSLFEQGRFSVKQLERLYGVSFSIIYRWIYKYSLLNQKGYRVVENKQSSSTKLKALEQRIKELEQMVGQKQIKIEFYEKMMEIAKDQFDMDIKKKLSTPRSTGTDNTPKQ